MIKPFIKKETTIDSSLFFYIASSIHKSSIIRKLLKTSWVLCDRYIYSTLAFHKVRGAQMDLLPPLEKMPIIIPDHAFLITAADGARLERTKTRGNFTADDLLPKKEGNIVDKTEGVLRQFGLRIVDNSRNGVHNALQMVVETIFMV